MLTGGPDDRARRVRGAVRDPSAFVAVTRTRMRKPTSAASEAVVAARRAGDDRAVSSVGPAAVGAAPNPLVRVRDRPVPVHDPVDDDSVRPCSARPLIVGSAVLDGGAAGAAIALARRQHERDTPREPPERPPSRWPSGRNVSSESSTPPWSSRVMTARRVERREPLRTSYTALHRAYRVVYDPGRRSGACR